MGLFFIKSSIKMFCFRDILPTTAYMTKSKFVLAEKLNKNGLYNNLSNTK